MPPKTPDQPSRPTPKKQASATGRQPQATGAARACGAHKPAGDVHRPSGAMHKTAGRTSNGAGVPQGPGRPSQRVSIPRWLFLALVAAVAVLSVACAVLGVRSCSTTGQAPVEPDAWVCPYNWENLETLDNGLLAYYENGLLASEAGVDVSEHDGVIDWNAVKAGGVDFAMIRLGYRGYGSEGSVNLDPYFVSNITNAKAAGVKVGVYFFSQAITADEAREEAQFVLDELAKVGVDLDYPVAFDEEPITNGDVARTDGISNEQLTQNAVAFCQAIERAGYTPMIYGNQHDLAKLDLTGELAGYDVWLAEYEIDAPTAQTDYVMWQYTEHGTVEGIPATVGWTDVNIRFLTE